MKRLVILLFVISGILVGCGEKELSYSEVSIDQVNADTKNFIDGIKLHEDVASNGIYLYQDTETIRYLYLNQDFLDSGKGFGEFEIKTDEDSFKLYLQENEEPSEDEYKLYKIKLDRAYEYMRVYKNGEETHIQLMGL